MCIHLPFYRILVASCATVGIATAAPADFPTYEVIPLDESVPEGILPSDAMATARSINNLGQAVAFVLPIDFDPWFTPFASSWESGQSPTELPWKKSHQAALALRSLTMMRAW